MSRTTLWGKAVVVVRPVSAASGNRPFFSAISVAVDPPLKCIDAITLRICFQHQKHLLKI